MEKKYDTQLILIVALALIVVLGLVAVFVLSLKGKPVDSLIISVTSTAIGGLTGLLLPRGGGQQQAAQPVTNISVHGEPPKP